MLALAAGFLVVACFAFSGDVVRWVGLGVGCAAVLLALGGFAVRGRGAGQRGLDLLSALVGGWLIVAARAFSAPETVKWLCFADAVALAGLALAGLVLRELTALRGLRPPPIAASHEGNGHRPGPHTVRSAAGRGGPR